MQSRASNEETDEGRCNSCLEARAIFPRIHTLEANWINIRLRFNPWNSHQSIKEVTRLSAFPRHGTIIPSKTTWSQPPLVSSSLLSFAFHPRLHSDNPDSYRLSIRSPRQPSSIVLSPYLSPQYRCLLIAQSANLFPLTPQNVNFEL